MGGAERFSDGKVSVPYKRFLGYDKGENDTLKINEEEAVIVRLIYRMFLEPLTPGTGVLKNPLLGTHEVFDSESEWQ